MKFKQMLDNIDDALSEDSFRCASLFICIGLVFSSIVVATIVGLMVYPTAMIPVAVVVVLGRIIYAALKGK